MWREQNFVLLVAVVVHAIEVLSLIKAVTCLVPLFFVWFSSESQFVIHLIAGSWLTVL